MLDTRVSRRPITRVLRLAVLVALVALTASIASFAAQSTVGSISGTIRDQLGGTVPEAVVALSHLQSGVRHEIRSDARGRFELVGLVPGNYRLEVKRPGFSSAEDALQLAAGQVLPRNVTLQVGSLQETISVVDGPAGPPPARRQRPLPTGEPTCTAEANSGSIHPPAKVRDVRPIYPASMSAAGTPGRVLLNAVIGTDGSVRELTTDEATNTDFEQAAHEAVRQWRFTQTTLNCVPIDVTMRVSVSFSPDGQSQPTTARRTAPPPPPPPPPPPVPPAPR